MGDSSAGLKAFELCKKAFKNVLKGTPFRTTDPEDEQRPGSCLKSSMMPLPARFGRSDMQGRSKLHK